MKLKLLAVATAGLFVGTAMAAPTQSLTTQSQKLSYTIGVDMGTNFKAQNIVIDPQLVAKGIQDAVGGTKTLLTKKQMQTTLIDFQKGLIAKQEAKFKSVSEKNLAQGEAFLAANKAKPGVVTLSNGLQYKIIKKGNGQKPSASDIVTVNYSGKTIDGKVFDDSYKTGKPVSFPVSQVIKGWSQALQMMTTGSTWEVYVPANLAYGARGMGGPIGPNETLIFKIQLLSVKGNANAAPSSHSNNTNQVKS